MEKFRGRILAPHLIASVGGDDLLALIARIDAIEAALATVALQSALDAITDMVADETLVGRYLGDPMYRKVLAIAAGPNNSTVNVAHGITGVADFVRVEGMITDGSVWRPLITPEGTSAQSMKFALTSTNLVLQSGVGGDYSGYAGHAVLLYTKAP